MELQKVQIKRDENEIETPGTLLVFDLTNNPTFKCDTLELSWLNNQHQISCIPKGIYKCRKVAGSGNIPYPHIAVLNVPDRDGICIHIGNYASKKKSDVLGCIETGMGYKDINNDGVPDIVNSGTTFKQFMAAVDNEFMLEII